MDDKWDNDLKNRIRDVFDNYEDEHADEGWLLLREKYPEKAKRRAVAWLWWGSVAAVLLVFVGIWWMNIKPVKKQNLASNKKQPINYQAQKPNGTEKESAIASNTKADSVINSLQDQTLASNTTHSGHLLKHSQVKTNHQPSLSVLTKRTNAKADDQNVIANNYIPKNDYKSNKIVATNQPKSSDQDIVANKNKIDNADKIDNNIKADNIIKPAVKSSTIVATKPGVNMQEEVKKTNKLPFSEDNNVVANKNPEKPKSGNKAVDFGVYAATYFNYAKGSSSQLNVGAGVTSDIKLSRNLDLSTGVTIAQNTLSYGNQLPPENNARLNASAVAPATTATASYLAASGQNIYSAVTPSLKNYNANLVGLDIPLNLKYEFNPEKSPTYISIGLSSGTFISETYTSTYNYSLPFVNNVSQSSDQSVHQSFNSFYFAKTLNFSFGTGYSVGRNKLIIEPFLKYPLDGLGSEQIKFGAGGVNLKFNFQTKKK